MTILDLIRDRFAATDWSIAEFARRSGVTRPWLSGILAGKVGTTVETADKLLAALGVDLEALVVEGDPEGQPAGAWARNAVAAGAVEVEFGAGIWAIYAGDAPIPPLKSAPLAAESDPGSLTAGAWARRAMAGLATSHLPDAKFEAVMSGDAPIPRAVGRPEGDR